MQVFLPLHRFILFLCLFSIIKNADSTLNAQSNWIEQKKYGVVHVIAYDKNEKEIGNGSGVVLKIMDGTAYIVTNNHVVKGASRIIIKDIDGKEIKILGDVKRDSDVDLALLITAEALSAKTIALNLDTRTVLSGEKVYLYGYPSGDQPVGKLGQILNYYGHKIGFSLEGGDSIKKTEGFSGGPLFDEYGNVIGIFKGEPSGQRHGINYAIGSGIVITVIRGLDYAILSPTPEEKLSDWVVPSAIATVLSGAWLILEHFIFVKDNYNKYKESSTDDVISARIRTEKSETRRDIAFIATAISAAPLVYFVIKHLIFDDKTEELTRNTRSNSEENRIQLAFYPNIWDAGIYLDVKIMF